MLRSICLILLVLFPILLHSKPRKYSLRRYITVVEKLHNVHFFYDESELDLSMRLSFNPDGEASLNTMIQQLNRYNIEAKFVSDEIISLRRIVKKTHQKPVAHRVVVDDEPSEILLDEVVVVGYGQQLLPNLTGAISFLNQSDVDKIRTEDAYSFMYTLGGIYTNRMGNQPGLEKVSLHVRGVGSMGEAKPLVMIDGIEGDLGSVFPSDIESISVLKDASAAIFGVKSSNGVVLVNTKRARKNGIEVSYSSTLSRDNVTYLPDVVWDPIAYMSLRNEALRNEGKKEDYSKAIIEEYKNGMKYDATSYPKTNWFDLIFKQGIGHKHHVSISSVGNRTKLYGAVAYKESKGVIDGIDAQSWYALLNIQTKLSNRLEISGHLRGNFKERNDAHCSMETYMSNVTRLLPIYSSYLKDGRYGDSWIKTPGRNIFFHPIAEMDEGKNNTHVNYVNLAGKIMYRLAPMLSYKAHLSSMMQYKDTDIFHPIVYTYNPKTLARNANSSIRSAEKIDGKSQSFVFNQEFNYNQALPYGNVELLLGSNWIASEESDSRIYADGFLTNNVTNITSGNIKSESEGALYRDRLMSVYSRLRLNYLNRYLLEAVIRADGSSRFISSNRWGYFPSLSVGWNVKNENFLNKVEFVDLCKLRFSIGVLGNQEVADYQYVNYMEPTSDYTIGGNNHLGISKSYFDSDDITWEKSRMYNIGIDLAFWDAKVRLFADIYRKHTYDMIQREQLPSQVGNILGSYENIGSIRNDGVEIALVYGFTRGWFSLNWRNNFSYVANRVLEMGNKDIINGNRIVRKGEALNSFYLYDVEGVFQTDEEVRVSPFQHYNAKPGDLKYRDVDGNGVINDQDKIVVGKSFPDIIYNSSLSLRMKRLGVDVVVQAVEGVSTYPTKNLSMPFYNGAGITTEWAENAWREDRKSNIYPRLLTSNNSHDNYIKPSVFWLKDCSYLRLKQLMFSYQFKERTLQKLHIKHCKLFFSLDNLLTLSDFKLFDPEKDIDNATLYEYPSTKGWQCGIEVKF